MGIFSRFDATYLKANDPITKRALWIREQRIGSRVWRWCVLTSPSLDAPRVWTPELDLSQTLNWDDPGQPLKLMPRWMYWLPVPMKYESLHWNGRVSGTLKIPPLSIRGGQGELPSDRNPSQPPLTLRGGEEWQLTHWPAQQGRLWGWRMSKEWAWAHGNCFVEDRTAAFEILTSGRRTVLCLSSQQLNLLANTRATWHCTQHEISSTHWNWTFHHNGLTIAGQFRLGYAEMVHLDYPTPQGHTRHCANTKVGSGMIEVTRNGRPLLQLTAHDTLAWEFVK